MTTGEINLLQNKNNLWVLTMAHNLATGISSRKSAHKKNEKIWNILSRSVAQNLSIGRERIQEAHRPLSFLDSSKTNYGCESGFSEGLGGVSVPLEGGGGGVSSIPAPGNLT